MEDRVLVFVHIPKTAGKSFRAFLKSYYKEDETIDVNAIGLSPIIMESMIQSKKLMKVDGYESLYNIPKEKLQKAKLMIGHFYSNTFNTSFSKTPRYITMLRNPVDHLISFYNHFVRSMPNHFLYDKAKNISFLEFLKDEEVKFWCKDFQTQYITKQVNTNQINDNHNEDFDFNFGLQIDEQKKYINIPDEVLFEKAKESLDNYFFVGITEMYQESVHLLTYYLNLKPSIGYHAINITDKKYVVKDKLSEEELEAIKEITRVDQKIYEYAKKTFKKKYNQMLINFLYDNYKDKSLKLDFSIKYDFLICGHGWNGRESIPEGTFNWTGPENVSSLTFNNIYICDYEFEIQIFYFMAQDILESLKIEFNNYIVDYKIEPNARGLMIKGVVPNEIVEKGNGDLDIKFHVNRTQPAIPSDPISEANRLLGIAFSSLELKPLNY